MPPFPHHPSWGDKAPTLAPPLKPQAREGRRWQSPGGVRQRPFWRSSPHPALWGAPGKLGPTQAGGVAIQGSSPGHKGLLGASGSIPRGCPATCIPAGKSRQPGLRDHLTPPPLALFRPGGSRLPAVTLREPGQIRPRTKLSCRIASKRPLTARLPGATPVLAEAQCPLLAGLQTDPGPGWTDQR